MTQQPNWKFVVNLGDTNPIEHGGYFVYQDTTGVYPDEIEYLEPPGNTKPRRWFSHRFPMERLKLVKGETSDREYLVGINYDPETYPHPLPQYEEWFTKSLDEVAEFVGTTHDNLVKGLCSEKSEELGWAYQCVARFFGWEQFDSEPLVFTRKEVMARFNNGEL